MPAASACLRGRQGHCGAIFDGEKEARLTHKASLLPADLLKHLGIF